MSEKIDISLDPKSVLDSVQKMGADIEKLAQVIEASLGKDAPKSFAKLEDAAEKGTGKIAGFFHNLGQRVKEDLKTAFDMGMVLNGAKFAKDISEGTKQVFEMERAFDKLNTRLKLSGNGLKDFKKQVGDAVAGTGQKLQDVLPGVESASARGGIKSPEQLTAIADVLGKARAVTGEDTGALSETIVEILKSQGREVNSQTFKETMDALQGTRVAGAFGSANEAGTAIEQLSPFAKQLGMGTREMGGMAAMASKSGSAGQDILKQIMEKGSTIGGQAQMNAAFGVDLFKNGKMNASALGKIDKGRFGSMSQQVMGEATGIGGATGADLSRFIDAFKGGMGDYNKTVEGANENMTQFALATDNLASEIDQFKEHAKNAGLQIMSDMSSVGHSLLHGDFKGAGAGLKRAGGDIMDNKGTIGMAMAVTAGIGMLTGGSLKSLLGKVGGGGTAMGVAKGKLMQEAAGVTPVFVTNASEIGIGAGGGVMDKLGSLLPKAGGAAAAGGVALSGAAVAGTALIAAGALTSLYKGFTTSKSDQDQDLKNMGAVRDDRGNFVSNMMSREDVAAMAEANKKAFIEAHKETEGNKKTVYTNPSNVTGKTGAGR